MNHRYLRAIGAGLSLVVCFISAASAQTELPNRPDPAAAPARPAMPYVAPAAAPATLLGTSPPMPSGWSWAGAAPTAA